MERIAGQAIAIVRGTIGPSQIEKLGYRSDDKRNHR
jgi:hypothetical protein